MRGLTELRDLTLEWSKDRGILTNGKAVTQALKLVSEVGELADNIIKGNNIEDDIGDCLVVLTNLAALKNTTLEACWNKAYGDIKDRKGFLNSEGTFIKSTDENYGQLYKEFKSKQESDTSWEAAKANENTMVITKILSSRLPYDIYTYHIDLAAGDSIEFYFALDSGCKIPDNLQAMFIGRSVAQLKKFLNTLGEVK
jgi:hypothetical protein